MNRADQIKLACVNAMERGLVTIDGVWDRERATAMLAIIQDRPKQKLPPSTKSDEIYRAVQEIISSLEDAEPEYVPKWAKQLVG